MSCAPICEDEIEQRLMYAFHVEIVSQKGEEEKDFSRACLDSDRPWLTDELLVMYVCVDGDCRLHLVGDGAHK